MGRQQNDGLLSFVRDNPDCSRDKWHAHLKAMARSDRERKNISDRISYYRKNGVIPDNWGKIHDYETQADDTTFTISPDDSRQDGSGSIESLFKDKSSMPAKDAAWELGVDRYDLENIIIDARARGIEIANIDGVLHYGVVQESQIETLGTESIVFGVMSDLHFGAKACQITAIKRFIDDCVKEGVTHILIPGDIVDGTGIYRGQDLEQYAATADSQESSVIRNLPVKKGLRYIALGGNHDESWMKNGKGHNPLRAIETQREDFQFIGFNLKTIPLLPGVDCIMWHPGGGAAYAKSYKLQNAVRNIALAELEKIVEGCKPTVRYVFGGHFHFYVNVDEGGIDSYICGAFAGRNGLTDQMCVNPIIKGLIFRATLDGNGFARRMEVTRLKYKSIPDDWKNYSHEPIETVIDRPLFQR